jgi:hypothetical protein
VEEGRLAYRVRTAESGDAGALRDAIGTTLAHPDHQGRRESYTGAASRGDILVLERFDRAAHDWQVAGFVECHMRVDDNLSIRDIGTTGDVPQTGVVRYLLDQAFNSFRPAEAQVKIRRDATTWLDIFRSIPGFYLEGEEYRRPHYWTIWRWDRARAREDERQSRQAATQPSRGPRPPSPPARPAQFGGNGVQPGPRPLGRPDGGPRPGGGGPPQRGPRPGGPNDTPQRGPRPGGPSDALPRGPRQGGPSDAPRGPRQGGPRDAPQRGPRPGGANGRPRRGGGPNRPGGRPPRPASPG